MQTIVLYSKEKDLSLLRDLRKALIEKGFIDNKAWNDPLEYESIISSLFVVPSKGGKLLELHSHTAPHIKNKTIIPVSRDDFQTLFLLG